MDQRLLSTLLIFATCHPLYAMQKPAGQPLLKPVATPVAMSLQPQPPITGYKAAGILPFGVDPQGKIHLLVGLENRSFKNSSVQAYAMDFGGKIDAQDNNNPAFSAAREGTEELTFIYDETPADFKRMLDAYKKFGHNFNVNTSGARTYKRILQKIQQDEVTGKPALYNNNNNFYVMYFPRFSYRDANQLFQARIAQYGAQIPHEWHEKSRLVWLKLTDVMNAIKAHQPKTPLVVAGPQGPITIWPYFADSLIQAYQRGILANLR